MEGKGSPNEEANFKLKRFIEDVKKYTEKVKNKQAIYCPPKGERKQRQKLSIDCLRCDRKGIFGDVVAPEGYSKDVLGIVAEKKKINNDFRTPTSPSSVNLFDPTEPKINTCDNPVLKDSVKDDKSQGGNYWSIGINEMTKSEYGTLLYSQYLKKIGESMSELRPYMAFNEDSFKDLIEKDQQRVQTESAFKGPQPEQNTNMFVTPTENTLHQGLEVFQQDVYVPSPWKTPSDRGHTHQLIMDPTLSKFPSPVRRQKRKSQSENFCPTNLLISLDSTSIGFGGTTSPIPGPSGFRYPFTASKRKRNDLVLFESLPNLTSPTDENNFPPTPQVYDSHRSKKGYIYDRFPGNDF